jgi:hypothetical protein
MRQLYTRKVAGIYAQLEQATDLGLAARLAPVCSLKTHFQVLYVLMYLLLVSVVKC